MARLPDPASWTASTAPTTLATTLFWVAFGLLAALLALYYLMQPLFNLGNLLLPASSYGGEQTEDGLLKSLAERPLTPAPPTKVDQPLSVPRR